MKNLPLSPVQHSWWTAAIPHSNYPINKNHLPLWTGVQNPSVSINDTGGFFYIHDRATKNFFYRWNDPCFSTIYNQNEPFLHNHFPTSNSHSVLFTGIICLNQLQLLFGKSMFFFFDRLPVSLCSFDSKKGTAVFKLLSLFQCSIILCGFTQDEFCHFRTALYPMHAGTPHADRAVFPSAAGNWKHDRR